MKARPRRAAGARFSAAFSAEPAFPLPLDFLRIFCPAQRFSGMKPGRFLAFRARKN
jgi:hypothetical protein